MQGAGALSRQQVQWCSELVQKIEDLRRQLQAEDPVSGIKSEVHETAESLRVGREKWRRRKAAKKEERCDLRELVEREQPLQGSKGQQFQQLLCHDQQQKETLLELRRGSIKVENKRTRKECTRLKEEVEEFNTGLSAQYEKLLNLLKRLENTKKK